MRRLRSHLSYANVTASLALFIAVSGAGAYAAGLARSAPTQSPAIRSSSRA